mmetsp:Transcript_8959/g.15038  ORF Transcript_8959/g.15038 Transcript_8959/m.15038 type:complete len:222 (-) Transcript_8959:18-683(-)
MVPTRLLLVGPTAFRTFRCAWMLEEIGVQYEHLSTAGPRSDDAKKHHPLGKIPALVATYDDDDKRQLTLYESAAINTFLGDAYDKLVPPPKTPERALYDQTIHFIMAELDAQALWIHRKHESLGHLYGKSDEAVGTAKQQFQRANDILLKNLNPYLMGDAFTAADILYVHCLDWAEAIGWSDAWDSEKLDEYIKTCHDRPAYQRVVAKRNQERENRKKSKL